MSLSTSVVTPIRPTVRRRAALTRFVGWTLALAAGTALAWLAGAMLTGATALAATPAAGAAAGRDRAAATVTGQPTTSQPVATGPAPRLAPAGLAPSPAPAVGLVASTKVLAPAAGRPAAVPVPAGSVWDRIAKCESGGKWKTSTGNGYHGGLQFKKSTWKSFGGTKYAPTADKATKAQQIEIAEKVQAKQGWKAWPTCAKKAGASTTTKIKKADHKTDHHKVDRKHDQHKADHKADHKASSKSGKAGKKASQSSRTKVQRGTAKPRVNTVPTLPKTPGGPVAVAAGDTLAKIAKDNKLPGGWKQLLEANKDKVSNPNLIRPGQELTLPAAK